MFMMYTFCRSELMYTKYIQDVCIAKRIPPFLYFLYTKFIQNVYKIFVYKMFHISAKVCIQNRYKMLVYEMYPIFRQPFVYILYTKFSWHSSFNFVYKMYTKVCRNAYRFCIQQLHTSCCIQNVYTVSVWELSYKFYSLIYFLHTLNHHIQDEAVFHESMLRRYFALSFFLTSFCQPL